MILQLTGNQQMALQALAVRCLGIPYIFGSKAPDLNMEPEAIKSIDCSGLTRYLFYKAGIADIGEGSNNQFDNSSPYTMPSCGDLAFKSNNGVIEHVAIALNQVRQDMSKSLIIIEASGSLCQVVMRDIGSFKTFPHGIDFAGFRGLLTEKIKML